jgi:hypothetical protein
VFTNNGIIKPTLLIDGFVSGIWSIKKEKGTVKLMIELFHKIRTEDRNALMEEGVQLLDFITDGKNIGEISFV